MTNLIAKRKPGRPARTNMDASAAIRSAALNVFAQKGFERASIVEIAKASNVAKPLVHYHYATKDALWQAAVSQAQLALMAELMAGLMVFLKKIGIFFSLKTKPRNCLFWNFFALIFLIILKPLSRYIS